MSSLVRTLEKRILKTLGLKRAPGFLHPVTGNLVQGSIYSSDGAIDYGNKWPQLVRLPGMSTTPQFAAMPRSKANLA